MRRGHNIPPWQAEAEHDIVLLNMEQTLGGGLLAGCTEQSERVREGWMGGKCLSVNPSFSQQPEPADVRFTCPVESQARGWAANGTCERRYK